MKPGTFFISVALAAAGMGLGIVLLHGQPSRSDAKAGRISLVSSSISYPIAANSTTEARDANGCPKRGVKWKSYTAPNHEFIIEYPGTTHPEVSAERQTALVSRTIFEFEQTFQADGNNGSLRFSVQVMIWKNPQQRSADAWAKQNTNRELISDAHRIQVGALDGYMLRETNQIAWVVHLFVARSDRLYEVKYTDITNDNVLIDDSATACWKATLNRMIDSFRLQ